MKHPAFANVIFFLFLGLPLWAQFPLGWNNARSQEMVWQSDSLTLDSLSVFPNSLSIYKNGELLSDSCWQLEGNKLLAKSACWKKGDSLRLEYQVMPYALSKPIFRKNRQMIGKAGQLPDDFLIGHGYTYNPNQTNADLADFKGLDYSGSFSRGISLGNKQDLILNSSFNLQISGMLGDVEVTGAISDNNIPLQPDGNTQQIQDFDRIYLQFKLNKTRLLAGDYDLKRPNGSYFLNYYRRLQGAQLGTGFKLKNDANINTDVSFAISKGSFARNVFLGQEGNQGPYRLKGANGEIFLIILAGTERVFVDGVLLTRGADNDYVIDYNLGEIVFTNKFLITKDKRIQVEFSYTDLNFLRTITTYNVEYQQDRTTVRLHWFSEQDAKNQPAQAELSDSAKAVLRRVGDDIDQAFIWGASIPDANQGTVGLVRYKLIDTLVAGVLYDSVLVFSTHPDSAFYSVRFSSITTGGHYKRVNDAVNGTIYQWVAPDSITGQLRGTHEPIELLVTPKQRQLLDVGVDYKIGKAGLLQSDFALSNRDLNTFSSVGNEDNHGIAGRMSYQHKIKLSERTLQVDSVKTKSYNTHLILGGHYEYLQKSFEFIEPYRPREFQRDWNTDATGTTQEHWFRTQLGLESNRWGQLGYEFGGLLKDSLYTGYRQALNAQVKVGGFWLRSNASLLLAEGRVEKSQFFRPNMDISYAIKPLKNLRIGVYGEQEQNRRMGLLSDTLQPNSFYYNVLKAYAEMPTNGHWAARASALRRFDYTPVGTNFQPLTVADELNFAGDWQTSSTSQLLWNLNYRNLRIQDSTRTSLDPKETYVGRVEYNLNVRKGLLRLNTIYELGAGQQQKLAYNYLEVDKGQGTHIWIDRNGDNVQQQNEFEQAVFQDQANFLRVTLLTGEFIRSNNIAFSQSFDMQPSVLFAKKKGEDRSKLDWIGRLSSRSLLKIERKTLPTTELLTFNPFQLNVSDTALVSVGSTIRNSIFWNRTETKFRLELSQSDMRSKTLLNLGFDTRYRTDYSAIPSLKLGKSFRGQLTTTVSRNENNSQFFPDRDYALQQYLVEPQLTYMYKTDFRASIFYKFKDSQNELGAKETAQSHNVTFEAKYYKSGKANTNIRTSLSWVYLDFVGNNNTPVQFAMTEGLLNGQNFLWTLSIDRSLSKNIQLTFSYEGRKMGEATVVHVGRAQIRAVF